MKAQPTTLALLIPLLAVAQASTTPTSDNTTRTGCENITCVPQIGAAHILVSRGSTERPGTGILGVVASAIARACPGSNVVANGYAALLDPYVWSETGGVDSLTRMALGYKECCPAAAGRMVLLGYSQGAQATADFLCGRSEVGFPATGSYAAAVADDGEFYLPFFFELPVSFLIILLCYVMLSHDVSSEVEAGEMRRRS